jgi:GH24 family phage-related lysozyme (muramidase)
MKISQQGIDFIKQFEGFRAKPYLCSAKVPTIGYGSTRYADGTPVSLRDPAITEAVASALFKDTLVIYEKAVTKAVKIPLEQYEFDALVSLCYNIGVGNLASSTLVRLLNEDEVRIEVAGQFLRWNKANSVVIPGLTRRREAEREMFLGL